MSGDFVLEVPDLMTFGWADLDDDLYGGHRILQVDDVSTLLLLASELQKHFLLLFE